MTEEEMVGWHHQLNGHEVEQTPGDGEGQGGLACFSPQGCKELDTTEQLNNNRARTSDRFYVGVSFEIDLKNQEKIDSF